MKHVPLTLIAALSATAPAQEKITYDDHVRVIFEDKCFSCHNPDKAKGGLDLTSYGNTLAGGSSGEIALSGEPGNSKLYNVLTHAEEPIMPPKGDKLGADKIDIVGKWLSGGLLETSSSTAKKAKKPAFAMTLDAPAGKPDGPPPMPGELALEPEVLTSRATVVADITTSPWAPVIAVTGQKQVLLHDANTLELLGVLPYPEGFPQTLTFSRSGKLVVAGGGRHGKSGNVVAWDITTGERVLEIGNEFDVVLAADINPSQTRVALGGPLKKVKLFNSATGKIVKTIDKHTEWVTALAFSPDGEFLATADRNGGILVWEADTGNEVHTLAGHKFAVTDLSWRPDSQALVSASDEDGQVMLWEMKEGKRVKNWGAHGKGTLSVQFASDGNIVTAGRDNLARVWKGDGAKLKDLGPGKDLFNRATFNHDGKIAYTTDWLGNLHAYNTSDGKWRGTLPTNPPSIATRIGNAAELVKTREAELAAAEKAKADTAAARTRLGDEIAALDSQLADAKSELQSANKEVAHLNAAQQRLSQESKNATQKRDEFQKQLGSANQSLQSGSQALQSAKATLSSTQNELAAKQKEIEAASEADKPTLQTQIDALNKKVAETEAQIQSHQNAVAAATSTRDSATKRRDASASEITKLGEERKQTAESLKAATSAANKAKTAIPNLEKQLAEKRKAIAPADTAQSEAATKRDQATAALDAARSKLDHWRKAQARLEEQRKNAEQTAAL